MRTLCILGLFGALFILYNGHILMNMSMGHHQSVHTSQKQVPSHAPQAASRESRQSMALRAPSSLPYNLQDNVGPYWSQNGQDRYIDTILKEKTRGFFIEAGGYNGESLSNTLFLERSREWTGLVLEANPHLFATAVEKHRKCYLLNAGFSISGREENISFKLAGPLGGYASTYTQSHLQRAEGEISQQREWMRGDVGSGEVVSVPTYLLHNILAQIKEIDGPPYVVDFFSLDTEGSELAILKAMDFAQVQVGVFVIEYNSDEHIKDALIAFMVSLNRGYAYLSHDGTDVWIANAPYMKAHSLDA
jgi:hypothetical protein